MNKCNQTFYASILQFNYLYIIYTNDNYLYIICEI